MTVPMDSSLDFSSRERVQHLYKKNVELENRRRRAAQARIPSDPNAWQQMRENYEAIILEDHAFSEQHEIEYALWQLHYRRIEELRAHFNAAVAANGATTTQSGKGSARPDRITKIRSQFKTFLSEATGFYHDLMLKIRSKYGLPLDYFSDYTANQIVISTDGNKSAEMKKGLISCHRCLIYLGDLSRYKGLYGEGDSKEGDFAAASSYYIQASSLWPSSGNPHHQLAILASYSGDELVTIYRYFRSLAVDNPFSTARDNLIIAFEKNRQGFSKILGDSKASSNKMAPVRTTRKGRGKGGAVPPLKDSKTVASFVKERASCISETFRTFCIRFVRLNGILFTRTSLETFGEVFSMVRGEFLELLSSGLEEQYNFGSGATENGLVIIRIVSILIFTVHNVNRENENQSYAEILQRSVLLQNAFTAIFELMGLTVERCVQLRDPMASFLLPGVLVFVEWLACHPDMLAGSEVEEKQATARSFFWNNCVSFLNRLLSSVFTSINEDEDESCFFNMSRYDEGETTNRLALWEDFELRGFLPLVPAQQILDFSGKQSFGSDGGNKEKEARAQRIIAAGKAIVSLVQVGQHSIYFDSKLKIFTIGVEPQPSNDFGLPSSMEMPVSNGTRQERPVEENVNLGVLQPNTQLYIEGEEEEDEVIVFKPSVTDKHADATSPKLVSYEAVRPDSIPSTGDFGCCGSVSTSVDGILLQNGFDTKLRPTTSIATIDPQHLQSIQASTSKWLMEQQDSLAGRLNDLSFMEILPPDALSLPLPQSVYLNAGNEFYGQDTDPVIPSKFDTIMSPGASFDNLTVKTSSALSSRKNPVSRPVRYLGPPPGFSPVPPKLADQSLSGNTLKDENLQMDDYSWLDGYQFPSSTKGMGFNNSINHSAETYHHFSKNNGFTGKINSQFLGKQVPTLPGQVENKKIWQDYMFPDHQKEFQNQQQQFQRINQQSFPLPEHHQGQSLWEGRFFV